MVFLNLIVNRFFNRHFKNFVINSNSRYLTSFKLPILNHISNKYTKEINRNIYINSNFNYKIRVETENKHVYKIMQSIPHYEQNLSITLSNQFENITIDQENFEKLLSKHYRTESASNILNTFKNVCYYSQVNNIPLSDSRFDKLVDGLMDKCQDLTDDELSELLYCINQFPKVETLDSHNFHDIWSALDDICCWRIQNWSIQKTLLFCDHWYQLGLSKYCDFTVQAIKKFCRKVKNLTPSELVQSLFYINICRKQWSMFEFELRVQECINDLSLNELAIVSMAFFKTETTIKEIFILSHMINKLLEETSTVHEITLSAILKIIRYSPHIPLADKIKELLTKLIPEIDRLSILCCVHIALTGTNIQLFHPEILKKISEKFVKNISETRLKDLERLMFALTLFNFDPNTTPNIFESVLDELKKPERLEEIKKYPRCFPCCVHYLGLRRVYPYDLINNVLDSDNIVNTYGKNKHSIGREILFINTSIDIDCPDYKGNRLSNKLQKSLTKWASDWIPFRNQKQRLTAADKLMLDITDTLEIIHGNNEYMHINYILPHFPKPDIVICKDKDDNPVSNIKKYYDKYKLGDIMKPEKINGYKWYAIVIGSWNMFCRGTVLPVGTLNIKLQHLEKIGYFPILVPWSEFLPLSRQNREHYLSSKIL